MKHYFITGVAGFIGSSMADRLLSAGHKVTGVDNFSTGQERFLEKALSNSNFRLIRDDILNFEGLKAHVAGSETVLHFAANADVRFGTEHPRRDLEQNTIATFNILEAMRVNNVREIGFSSTGSVYGETTIIPTPENAPFPVQTSLYAASKLAGEGLIAAYCEGFGMRACIFRFVSILGERYTHGHVFDFYRQLKEHPAHLRVLGNGKQRKSYLYIQDCLDAVLVAMEKAPDKVNIFNLGVDGYCEVVDSIAWISETLGASPELQFSGGQRGWIGDNPFIFLETSKICSLGWSPKVSIRDGVIKTVKFLQNNEWVFDVRE